MQPDQVTEGGHRVITQPRPLTDPFEIGILNFQRIALRPRVCENSTHDIIILTR